MISAVLFLWQRTINPADSSFGYRIGYEAASWLPFVIIAGLLILVLLRARRYGKEQD